MNRRSTPRRALAIAALLASTLAAGRADAYSYLESSYGTPVFGQSSRGLGMGGAMVAVPDGSFSLVENPAMLATQGDRAVELSARVVNYDETRYVPLYDSFDSFIKETAVSENPNIYARLNGGVLWTPKDENARFAVAGGIFERFNFQYDFVDERRVAQGTDTANRDKIKATQFISSNTSIYSASAGISYREKILSLGATLHYYFGNLTFANSTVPGNVPSSLQEPPALDVLDRNMDGVGATFGMAAQLDERATVAAAYTMPVTFDTDWRRETLTDTTRGANDVDYPGQLSLGLSLKPRNNPRTVFALSALRTFWKDDLVDPVLAENPVITIPTIRNTWDFRAGVEHTFYNNLPARFGFIYRELYADENADEAGVSFGTGYKFQAWDVGISMDVMKRESRQKAITPRPANVPQLADDRVTDSLLRGVIDVRYRF